MIELLKNIDTHLFFLFNGHHTPFMDSVMGLITDKYTWIPFYLILLFFVWKKVKSKMWLVVLSVAILITLSDQTSVLVKDSVQRFRPCKNLLLKDKVQLIEGHCGGDYGFVSSHAANTFALTTFLIFFFRRKDFALCMYLWAAFVSYSRVYAGVHYPFDILGGMMLGIILGIISWKIYFHLNKKYVF